MKYQQRGGKHSDNFSLMSFHAMLSLLTLMALLASQVGDLSLHNIQTPGSISCPSQAYHERVVNALYNFLLSGKTWPFLSLHHPQSSFRVSFLAFTHFYKLFLEWWLQRQKKNEVSSALF